MDGSPQRKQGGPCDCTRPLLALRAAIYAPLQHSFLDTPAYCMLQCPQASFWETFPVRRYLHRFSFVLFVFVFGLSLFAADDLRTWSDSTGKYTLEAKFIGIEGGKVILEKADGSRIQIELSKLKAEDRTEAVKLNSKKMGENPFKNEEENPFKNNGSRKNKNNNATEPDPNVPALTAIDWAGAKQLSVFGSEWKAPLPSIRSISR